MNCLIGVIVSYDISLFLFEIVGFIDVVGVVLVLYDVCINCFGYLGDGNLYYNLFFVVGCVCGDYDG